MNTKEAIEKIREVHGDKYSLSDGWEYVNARADIKLFCKEHGEFHKDFYRLVNMKQGCPVCSHNGRVYKSTGYWNIYENCLEEAKKYHNKHELERKCIGCYQGIRRNGWLDDISNKVFDNTIQYKGYDEKINLVYIYKFDEFKVFYVGRTNGLKRRDRQHRNGYGHTDGTREYDNVYKFAEEHNVDIPTPIILEENLDAIQSQEREDYWKKIYIDDGWTAINKAVTGVGKGSLGATIKWTYEACLEESKKYGSKYEMKVKNQSAYNASLKNGWIDEFFANRKRDDNYWDDFEHVMEAARKSKNCKDMVEKFGGAYNSARKHKWNKLLVYGTEI